MKNTLRTLLSLLLIGLLLSGCWQAEVPEEDTALLPPDERAEEEETPSSVLPQNFSLPYAPAQTLDPITCPDGMQQVVTSLICEGLFRLDGNFRTENVLCAGYTYDPASYTYVFTLQENVLFSDGSPLTASDVKASLDRARQSARYQARLARVVSVSAKDGAVTVRLSAPDVSFPALLDIPIVKSGTQDVPTGTGPYVLTARDTGKVLTANPHWRQGKPPVECITLVEAADADAMRYRFISHDVQLITADLTGSSSFTATGRVGYQDAGTTVLQYIVCNTTLAPLDNPALRQALSMGVNREDVAEAFLSGHGIASQFPVSPLSDLYPSELETRYSYDAFVQALKDCNYVPERTLTLLVNEENAFKVSVAAALAEDFTAAGVPVEIRVLPWDAYTLALEEGDFDLCYGEVRLPANWDLSGLLSSGGALNYGGWTDGRTDALLSAWAKAGDSAAMEALCRYLWEQSPILPVCFKSVTILTQAEVVEGLTPTAQEPFYHPENCVIHLREEEDSGIQE